MKKEVAKLAVHIVTVIGLAAFLVVLLAWGLR